MNYRHRKKPVFVSVRWVADTHEVAYNTVRRAVEVGDLDPAAFVAGSSNKRSPVFTRGEVSRWVRRRRGIRKTEVRG